MILVAEKPEWMEKETFRLIFESAYDKVIRTNGMADTNIKCGVLVVGAVIAFEKFPGCETLSWREFAAVGMVNKSYPATYTRHLAAFAKAAIICECRINFLQ